MHAEPCHLTTDDGNFFDITHTFKAGPATYHILGLRKDRPTYNNTYYIFNCTDNQHQSTNDIPSVKSARSKHSKSSLSSHGARRISADHLPTRPVTARPRIRTESPKKGEIDVAKIQEELTKAIRENRQFLLTSVRKEMNIKKKSILRTMKKDKETLLKATSEANQKEEIIRLLEEQKQTLENFYERCINNTTDSIDSLKQTLIEMLESQRKTSQSTEQQHLTLIQAIEQEVQKIVKKNEEILRLTSAETHAINQLQNTIIKKIEDQSNLKKNQDDDTLKRLFDEQQRALTNVIEQQQQTFSTDLVKQTILEALHERKSMPVHTSNHVEQPQTVTVSTIASASSEQNVVTSNTISNKMTRSLTHVKSNQHLNSANQSLAKMASKGPADQHLFKVSIHSPEPAHLFAKLIADGMECSRRLHTLCQRDPVQKDLFNCYIAPPTKDGPYEVTIYAKTNNETIYRSAISIRLPGLNSNSQPVSFPMIHQSFEQHQCILIEPFHRLLRRNQQVLIHMIVPGAQQVKIRNGDENCELDGDEYKNDVVRKKVRVRGDVHIIGCWNKKIDSTICIFNVV